jgi:hypothetical protein
MDGGVMNEPGGSGGGSSGEPEPAKEEKTTAPTGNEKIASDATHACQISHTDVTTTLGEQNTIHNKDDNNMDDAPIDDSSTQNEIQRHEDGEVRPDVVAQQNKTEQSAPEPIPASVEKEEAKNDSNKDMKVSSDGDEAKGALESECNGETVVGVEKDSSGESGASDDTVRSTNATSESVEEKHDSESDDDETPRTEAPRRPAEGTEIDVSISLPKESAVDVIVQLSESSSSCHQADKRQESEEIDSVDVKEKKESREGGVVADTEDHGTNDSSESSEGFVVSLEATSKRESDKDISRTQSQGTSSSDYSAPVSPWADLRTMLSAVKRRTKAGNESKIQKEDKKAQNEGVTKAGNESKIQKEDKKAPEEGGTRVKTEAEANEVKKQSEKEDEVSCGSDLSGEECYVEFSSDQASNRSEDEESEKNPYLDDDDDDNADSGRDTPKLKELSESASIAMTDLRNMLSVVNSRLKKDIDTCGTPAVQEAEFDDELDEIKAGVVMGYEADEEEMAEEDDESQSSSVFLRKHSTFLLGDDSEELAHKFADHTYKSPTNCGICKGLLVGLWSQGLQCEICGLNVHRGEGVDGHDDCRKEALLSPCSGKRAKEEEPATTLREVMKQSPTFFQDIKEQMNKDIKSQVKSAVVTTGVEGEKSKKIRRFRDKLIPLVETLDSVEARGGFFSFLVLMSFHIILVNALGLLSFVGFILALWPRHGLMTTTALRSAFLHDCTVLCTVHVCLLFLSLFLRRMATTCKRKSNIFDQFLRDVFKIDAKEDLGISVAGFTTRARAWSGRIVLSSAVTCFVTIVIWHIVESPVEELSTSPTS